MESNRAKFVGKNLIGLGTYKIRGSDVVFNTLNAALGAGYRCIDTAAVYRNEQDIGNALKTLLASYNLTREDISITSKLAPKNQGNGKCRSACLESVRQLQTEYLDLYLIHWPGVQKVKPDSPVNAQLRKESWQDLEELHKEGVVNSIGVSNYTIKHMEELLAYCRVKPAVLQTEYHPHLVQKDLVDFCRDHDIHFQAYSSLGTTTDDNKLLTDAAILEVAKQCSKTPAQILLKWAVQQGIGVLPKSTNPQHIKENMDIFDFTLSEDDMGAINALGQNIHYCWNPDKIT